MKFTSPLYAVRSMAVSKAFYQDVLGQKVIADLGINVTFESGFALQEGFAGLVGFSDENTVYRAYNGELYFETHTLEEGVARLKHAGVELLHDVKEYPWGQRVFRFFDPDGHIIELGEAMDHVIGRFLAQGMSVEETAQRTQFPVTAVRAIQGALGQ